MEIKINETFTLTELKEILSVCEYYQTTDGLNEIEEYNGKIDSNVYGDEVNFCIETNGVETIIDRVN